MPSSAPVIGSLVGSDAVRAASWSSSFFSSPVSCTDDPGVRDALGFLMTREIAHQQSFEKALYSMTPNFPPGKLPGDSRFTNVYFNMSQGEGDARGPWNSDENFEFVSDRDAQQAIDGDGEASVELSSDEEKLLQQLAARTASDPTSDPMTGAELGMGGEVAAEKESGSLSRDSAKR